MESDMPSSSLPLQGVRVLDLSRVLAGPLCSMILGDLGADVIKIESFRGDDTRHWGPPWQGTGEEAESAYYLSVKRNKRSVAVNLKSAEGVQVVREMARGSQVVLENFRPGKATEFALDWDSLSELNSSLVYCSISGFGQNGPYRDRPGYDYVVQAMSGLMSITGPALGQPSRVGVPISDVLAGLFSVNSVLAALRHSERTGEGQFLDVSLLDSQLASLVNVAGGFLVDGVAPQRHGNQHPNIVPYQVFQGVDQPFVVAAGNDSQFGRLCSIVGRPNLSRDHRFETNGMRVQNRAELIAELDSVFRLRPAAEWVSKLLEAAVPAGPILTVAEALQDSNTAARGLIQESDGFRSLRHPVKFSATDPRVTSKPPRLGEHTSEVLTELLGLSREQIEELHQKGAIRCLTE